jgi:CheY-like chemotaxis protein
MTERIQRVVIADDDALIREFLTEFLEQQGIEARAAENTAQAFRLLSEQEADLVLTDLRMPGEDGLSLLRKIRASGRTLPVVVMTAYGSVETAVSALKQGALDFLTKPLSPPRRTGLRAPPRPAQPAPSGAADRFEPGAPRPGRHGHPGGPLARHGADHRRERHRQGTVRALDPPGEPAPPAAVRQGQLRRPGGVAVGERAVRT